MLRLYYAGNNGLMFVGARVNQEGFWLVVNNAFAVQTVSAMIAGTFVRPGRIEGTWQEGRIRGTWSADRVDNPPPELLNPDAGTRDTPPAVDTTAPPPRPLDARPDRPVDTSARRG